MGFAKEKMIEEEDRLSLVERQKEEAEMEADNEHEADEKITELFKSVKMYFTIYEYECAEQLGLYENCVYETSLESFHKLIDFILDNPKGVTDNLFADSQIIPISFSPYRANIEVIAKTNCYPTDDNFDFDKMVQSEGDNGFKSMRPEDEVNERTDNEYQDDQFLINQQASTINRLEKEIVELKKQ